MSQKHSSSDRATTGEDDASSVVVLRGCDWQDLPTRCQRGVVEA